MLCGGQHLASLFAQCLSVRMCVCPEINQSANDTLTMSAFVLHQASQQQPPASAAALVSDCTQQRLTSVPAAAVTWAVAPRQLVLSAAGRTGW